MRLICFLFFVSFSAVTAFAQTSLAREFADEMITRNPDTLINRKFEQHLLQDNQMKPGESVAEAQKRAVVWAYETGVALMGVERLYDVTGDKRYIEYIKRIVDPFIEPDGTIKTFVVEEYNSDAVPLARQLLSLHRVYGEEKYLRAARKVREQISWMPRNRAGGFWHKLKYPSQMWLDGLYMVQPFYAAYARKNGESAAFEDIADQFAIMEKHSRDARTGLLKHGWDESRLQKWADPKTGLSPEFWSRAMGWYMMGLVDALDYFPEKHPRRPELIAILRRLASAVIRFQDRRSGVWWNITDKAGKSGNYPESSATAMFVYALAKGVRLGYLPVSLKPAVRRGFDGMLLTFVRRDLNGATFVDTISGAGLGGRPYRDGTFEYYNSEPKRDNDLKALGPLIQACLEMERR